MIESKIPALAAPAWQLGNIEFKPLPAMADLILPSPSTAAVSPARGFAEHLWGAVRNVDKQDQLAGARMEAVDSGRSDDLAGAMLASQEASLSFAMLMQVRNKVVGAMDELIKLPL